MTNTHGPCGRLTGHGGPHRSSDAVAYDRADQRQRWLAAELRKATGPYS
jgi:hypothetical protein